MNFSYLYIGYHAFKAPFLPGKGINSRRKHHKNKYQEQKRDPHVRE